MARRPRNLRPEEAELWQRVASSAQPLTKGRKPLAKPALAVPGSATTPEPAPQPPLRPFRLGATRGETAPLHDLSPPMTERLAQAPVSMDRKAFNRLTRGKLSPEARLDLHGMTLAEARPALLGFVTSAHARGLRLVLVITGKGRGGEDDGPIPRRRGALRHEVPHWLMSAPLKPMVLELRPAHRRHGGEGALYVYLRRARG